VLISGVVLLTHKKPEPGAKPASGIPLKPGKGKGKNKSRSKPTGEQGEGEQDVLWAVGDDSDNEDEHLEEGRVEDGDGDDDVDHHQNPIQNKYRHQSVLPDDKGKGKGKGVVRKAEGEEGVGLIYERDEEEDEGVHEDPGVMDRYQHQPLGGAGEAGSKTHLSSHLDLRDPFKDEPQGQEEEFGDWEGVRTGPAVVGRR
jgi:hypothetical protein